MTGVREFCGEAAEIQDARAGEEESLDGPLETLGEEAMPAAVKSFRSFFRCLLRRFLHLRRDKAAEAGSPILFSIWLLLIEFC